MNIRAPIMLIKYINTPPSIELNTIFKIVFNGITNTLPNKNNANMQAKKVIIAFVSIFVLPYILTFIFRKRTNMIRKEKSPTKLIVRDKGLENS